MRSASLRLAEVMTAARMVGSLFTRSRSTSNSPITVSSITFIDRPAKQHGALPYGAMVVAIDDSVEHDVAHEVVGHDPRNGGARPELDFTVNMIRTSLRRGGG